MVSGLSSCAISAGGPSVASTSTPVLVYWGREGGLKEGLFVIEGLKSTGTSSGVSTVCVWGGGGGGGGERGKREGV